MLNKRTMKKYQNSHIKNISQIYVPVPVGKGHHDIKRSQEKHEVKEGITVGNTIPFIIYCSMNIIAILKRSITPGSIVY